MKIKTTHIRVHNAGELFSEIAAKLTEEHANNGNGRVETDDFEMEGYTWSCVGRIDAESKTTHYRDTPPEHEWTYIFVEIIEILCTDEDGDEVDATYFDEKGKEIGDDELIKMVENFLTGQ